MSNSMSNSVLSQDLVLLAVHAFSFGNMQTYSKTSGHEAALTQYRINKYILSCGSFHSLGELHIVFTLTS